MKNLIGKKVRGFKFTYGKHGTIMYSSQMDNYVGEIGTITDVLADVAVQVLFYDGALFGYPLPLVKEYLVKDNTEQDNVNSPSHYTKGGIECIDAIEASMTREAFLGYLKGNIQKYIFRYESKSNPTEDLKKAQWYLNKLISKLES